MELQKNILLFLASLRTPFLNQLVEFITMLGEEFILLSISLFIFWCTSKKKGFTISFVLMTSIFTMQIIKSIIRFPRPWQVYPEEIRSLRKSTATGYSFPSGHTTMATSFYGCLSKVYKKKLLSILCGILIVLIGLSRLYLGVHWPLDVVGGLLLGSIITFTLTQVFERIYDNKKIILKIFPVIALLLIFASLFISILLNNALINYDAFSDFSKSTTMFGALLLGFSLEERLCKFNTDGSMIKKIIRYILGILGAYIFLVLSKKLFINNPITSWIRYCLTGIWITFIWPFIGSKLKLFSTDYSGK